MSVLVRNPAKPFHQPADTGTPPPEPDFDDRFDDRRVKLLFLGRSTPTDDRPDPTLYFLMTPRNVNFDGSAQPDHATYFAMTPTTVTATVWDEAIPLYASGETRAIKVKENRTEWSLPFEAKDRFAWKLFNHDLEEQIINLWAGTVIKRLFSDHKKRARKMYRKLHEEFEDAFNSTQLLEDHRRYDDIIWPGRTRLLLGYGVRLALPWLAALAYFSWDIALAQMYSNGGFPWPLDIAVAIGMAIDFIHASRWIRKERRSLCPW